MKLLATLFLSFSFAVSAFGVSSDPAFAKKAAIIKPTTFQKDQAAASPLFRDPAVVRGGAVPGWAAYNQALDDKPLITKAMTSLVGWALGDLLAQVGRVNENLAYWHLCPNLGQLTYHSFLTLSFVRFFLFLCSSSFREDPLT